MLNAIPLIHANFQGVSLATCYLDGTILQISPSACTILGQFSNPLDFIGQKITSLLQKNAEEDLMSSLTEGDPKLVRSLQTNCLIWLEKQKPKTQSLEVLHCLAVIFTGKQNACLEAFLLTDEPVVEEDMDSICDGLSDVGLGRIGVM